NKWGPDAGRVASLDNGCGEHSEIEPPEPSRLWVQANLAFDGLHIDVVAHRPRKQEPAELDDEADESDKPEADDEQLIATESPAPDTDEATEEDNLENTDDDGEDEDDVDDEPGTGDTAEEVTPGHEAVVEVIEKQRQTQTESG
ncbi:UNVERIFIED_CONTAM: DUF3027 domain-containing protein, partial [Bifidobacterium breve]|nr:DUF3027 domain-containing protein [Bifidobacterium breve]